MNNFEEFKKAMEEAAERHNNEQDSVTEIDMTELMKNITIFDIVNELGQALLSFMSGQVLYMTETSVKVLYTTETDVESVRGMSSEAVEFIETMVEFMAEKGMSYPEGFMAVINFLSYMLENNPVSNPEHFNKRES